MCYWVSYCWRPLGAGTLPAGSRLFSTLVLACPPSAGHECRRGRLRVCATTDAILPHRQQSPMQKVVNATGLSFAGHEFLAVGQCDQPSLAAEGAHLSNVIDIYQRVPMNPPK